MRRRVLIQLLLVVVFGMFSGTVLAQEPGIEITYVPAWCSNLNLQGIVWDVNPSDHAVLVYIYVEGEWWVKPYSAIPLTPIQSDCTWTCNVATGGYDHYATRFAAFLVPDDFDPPCIPSCQDTLPAELYLFPYDVVCRQPGTRVINFSGYNWVVKQCEASFGSGIGPGPNFFSDDVTDVWVDGFGKLHMKISYRNSRWYCSEVVADTSFGYGTYVFYIESSVDSLNENVVVGLFTWDECVSPQEPFNHREIDIEFSKWGDALADTNAQYVIQPWDYTGNRYMWVMSSDTCTTHLFDWQEDSIFFRSSKGYSTTPTPSDIIESWIYYGDHNPFPGNENPRINCWLVDGQHPSNSEEVEIIISGFEYMEYLPNISVEHLTIARVEPHVILSWDSILDAISYNVYGGSDPGLTPNPANYLGSTTSDFYSDMNILSQGGPAVKYYCVTAIFPD